MKAENTKNENEYNSNKNQKRKSYVNSQETFNSIDESKK